MDKLLMNLAAATDPTLSLAIVWIINECYAPHSSSAVVLGQYSLSKSSQWYYDDLLDEILQKVNAAKFIIESKSIDESHENNVRDKNKISSIYLQKTKAIFMVDSLMAYTLLEKDLLNPDRGFERNGRFIIIYTGKEKNRMNDIMTIFTRLFKIYVINVNIIVTVDDVTHVYTYFPFKHNNCHSTTPELLVSFESENDIGEIFNCESLFPRKTKNMNGCELRVTALDQHPFIYYDSQRRDGEMEHLRGIEGLFISLLAERLNFTIKMDWTTDRGDVLENGTAVGASKSLIEGETDMTVAYYLLDQRRPAFMSPVHSYLTCPMAVIIPSGQRISAYEVLIRPFHPLLWRYIISDFLGFLVVLFFMRLFKTGLFWHLAFGEKNYYPITVVINTMFGGSVPIELGRGNATRLILIVWITYTLVLRTVYVAKLYTILQDDRLPNKMEKIDAVMRNNYTLYAPQSSAEIITGLIDSGEQLKFYDLEKQNFSQLVEPLMTGNPKYVVLACEFMVQVYNHENAKSGHQLVILPEYLINLPVTFYLRKHSFLQQEINDLILNALSAGLMEKFHSQYTGARVKEVANSPSPLSMSQLTGIFTIYIALLLFSQFLLLMELLSRKSEKLRRVLNFVNL